MVTKNVGYLFSLSRVQTYLKIPKFFGGNAVHLWRGAGPSAGIPTPCRHVLHPAGGILQPRSLTLAVDFSLLAAMTRHPSDPSAAPWRQ